MGLDISDASFAPDVVGHIPGIGNVAADRLSRRAAPNAKPLPSYLVPGLDVDVPVGLTCWYRSRPALP